MHVLYFGTYERSYPRNALVISALRKAGVKVAEHHVSVWEAERHKFGIGPSSALRLARAEGRLLRKLAVDFDVLLVGYPGHFDMRAAKRVASGRPVVFNPLVSLEDTVVGDRALASASSLRGRVLRAIDRKAFRAADLVVADTAAHGAFFRRRFGLSDAQISVCYVGAEDRLFHPDKRGRSEFNVLFVGKLIPLHGIETILAAAAICEEIPFVVVGSGQLDAALARVPPNVRWEPWVDYDQLPDLYRSAGCALGIFGLSEKAARVIPNKAFQALATQTALITADTPAARELLCSERDALLIPRGDAEALASAIRRLAGDSDLRDRIARQGRETYVEHASEHVLGIRWRSLLDQLVA